MSKREALILVLTFLTSVDCKSFETSDNKPSCESDNGIYIDLSSSGLNSIKKFISGRCSVTCVNLEGNNLTEIENETFENSDTLVYLNLARNKLSRDFLSTFAQFSIETLVLDEVFKIEKEEISEQFESDTSVDALGYVDAESYIDYDEWGNRRYGRRPTPTRAPPPRTNSLQVDFRLPKLQKLYLRNNNISGITFPSWTYNLPNLTHLYLSGNDFESVNVDDNFPESLTHLYLEANGIQHFQMSLMHHIKVLYLNNNPLERFFIGIFIEPGFGKDLEELSLSSTLLSETALRTITYLENLNYLDISGNSLHNIPDYLFRDLIRLSTLKLDHNLLLAIPDICSLTELTELSLSHNNIHAIEQNSFCNSTTLEIINLSNNHISQLPSGVFNTMTSLISLDLSKNNLVTLPENWFIPIDNPDLTNCRKNVRSKRELQLGSRESPVLPDWYPRGADGVKVCLEYINLGGNPLKNISLKSFAFLPKTIVINVEDTL